MLERYNESWKYDYHLKSELGNILYACICQADTGVMKWSLKKNRSGKKQKSHEENCNPNYLLFVLQVAKAQKQQKAQPSG